MKSNEPEPLGIRTRRDDDHTILQAYLIVIEAALLAHAHSAGRADLKLKDELSMAKLILTGNTPPVV